MELNADFNKRVVVHSNDISWQASPMAGVDRRMLDRIGGEVARATSIVRYAPKSHFSAHIHTGGEEFLVLEGVFQDEHGDFPAGTYVRNPPTSSHTPGSEMGCTIFVKLWQFEMDDRTQFKVDTNTADFEPISDGIEQLSLHNVELEQVSIEKWAAGAEVDLKAPGGMEILVLDGGFEESGEHLRRGSWLRLPKATSAKARAGSEGARVWIKRGHLAQEPKPPKT